MAGNIVVKIILSQVFKCIIRPFLHPSTSGPLQGWAFTSYQKLSMEFIMDNCNQTNVVVGLWRPYTVVRNGSNFSLEDLKFWVCGIKGCFLAWSLVAIIKNLNYLCSGMLDKVCRRVISGTSLVILPQKSLEKIVQSNLSIKRLAENLLCFPLFGKVVAFVVISKIKKTWKWAWPDDVSRKKDSGKTRWQLDCEVELSHWGFA